MLNGTCIHFQTDIDESVGRCQSSNYNDGNSSGFNGCTALACNDFVLIIIHKQYFAAHLLSESFAIAQSIHSFP